MRKILLSAIIFFTISFPVYHAEAANLIDFSSTPTIEDQNLFKTITDWRNQKSYLLGLTIELEQAEERVFPEAEEVNRLGEKLKNLNSELAQLEAEKADAVVIEKKKKEIEDTRFKFEEQTRLFHDTLDLHEKHKQKIQAEIDSRTIDIEKLEALAKEQAINLAIRIGLFFGFLLLILFLRFFTEKMIHRLSGHIPIPRERALVRINKVVFNAIIAISLVVAIFSQFVSLIPLLAVLGTAIAFALRDILASFIAWFVIGTEQGYKIGDLIEVTDTVNDKIRGRVVEVHPFLTILRQTGLRGDTGQVISFPNKLIFDHHIRNFSKMYRFTYIMIEFLLERNSDVEIAREALSIAIQEENSKDIEEAKKNLPNLQTRFGITEEQIDPQIFIEPDPKGIMLRGKYFCRLESRHMSRTNITTNFLKRIREHPNDIKLRFVQWGE